MQCRGCRGEHNSHRAFSSLLDFFYMPKKAAAKKKKRRGYSKEEKAAALLQFFQTNRIPFTTSEFTRSQLLAKFSPALRSLRQTKQIKEILDILESEGQIQSDKIGASQYFWSFPSAVSNTRKRKLEQVEGELEESASKRRRLDATILDLSSERVESETRTSGLQELSDLRSESTSLQTELERYRENDPRIMQQIWEQVEVASAGAERWTDNTYQVQKTLLARGMERKRVGQMLGMNEQFDDAIDRIQTQIDRQRAQILSSSVM